MKFLATFHCKKMYNFSLFFVYFLKGIQMAVDTVSGQIRNLFVVIAIMCSVSFISVAVFLQNQPEMPPSITEYNRRKTG